MTQRFIKAAVLICILIFGTTISYSNQSVNTLDNTSPISSIENGFRVIPDSTQLAAYWYWIAGHMSKEGVVADLHAMKSKGIGRAFIGFIDKTNRGIPTKIKMFTPEWWDILHVALKTATELGIEIGIFNSPGWSQSGGPWVQPNQSMRFLASADTVVSGGSKSLKISLPILKSEEVNLAELKGKDPERSEELDANTFAEDVKIIAYPFIRPFEKEWSITKLKDQAIDKKLLLGSEQTIRTIMITTKNRVITDANLFVKEGDQRRLLKTIRIDRSRYDLNGGFDPYAPIVISIPETNASEFYLELPKGGNYDLNIKLTSRANIERYPEKTMAKMFQRPLPMFKDYLWDDQPLASPSECIDQSQIIDLTDHVKNGVLTWNDAPKGEWIVSRMGMLTTGTTNAPAEKAGVGFEIDKMSRKHVRHHFDSYIGEILRRIPEADRKTFKVVVQDSYETGGQNWTDDMIERFESVYAYDPVPFLPTLHGVVVESQDVSDRFLWDLRRLIADRVSYDFVGGFKKVSNEHGLITWLENYGHWGFPGEFLQYGGQSDEIGGEFWTGRDLGDIENKAASSCAHIYGKRKVWAESFTSGQPPFSLYPLPMKQRADRFFTEGINATLLHVYIHQPDSTTYPGVNAGFGTELNRKNTWYSQLDVFTDYLRRCNFMLQQGLYIADVAYFIGEDTPKMTGVCDPELPKGYSFDYINAEVLLTRAQMKDGFLTLPDGMRYRVLVMPKLNTIRPNLLARLETFVRDGLIVLGPKPERSPSLVDFPNSDKKVKELASKMWGDGVESMRVYGDGKVFTGDSLTELFANIDLKPDLEFKGSGSESLLFIHRQVADADIYFVSNQSDKSIDVQASFRVANAAPELWDLSTVDIRTLEEYSSDGTQTTLPLSFNPLESMFIVFKKGGKTTGYKVANFPSKELVKDVDSKWNVTFKTIKGDVVATKEIDKLEDWIKFEDESIRYFSGTGIYETTFEIKELSDTPHYIDLGDVKAMAKVSINGKYVGGVWTYPYQINVSPYLKEGTNSLRVEVVNTWQNRLIGDAGLPKDQRSTSTFINRWRKDSKLQSSGLLGPVQIVKYPYIIR